MLTAACPEKAAEKATRATLTRAARLLKAPEFTAVFKNNQATSDDLFRVLWRVNDGERDRLGMAVSRKVDRRAVGRNRIKRVVREQFRRWRAERAGATEHYDLVVMPRPRAAQTGNAELGRALHRLWRRVGHGRATRNKN